jgi:serine/threonine protein kinase
MNRSKPVSAAVKEEVNLSLVKHSLNVPKNQVTAYHPFLSGLDIPYEQTWPYLMAGKPGGDYCWLLHISVIRQHMPPLLNILLPELIKQPLAFIIPENTEQHNRILDGRHGPERTGKVISICTPNPQQALALARVLTRLSAGFKGPEIPSAVLLSGCIYTSYGPLLSDVGLDRSENKESAEDSTRVFPSGNSKNLKLPRQLKWPFHPITTPKPSRLPKLIHGQYLPVEILKNDPKGKVIKCLKVNRIFDMQWCILKQGKQHQCADDAGRDIKDRLVWQYQVQQALATQLPVPAPLSFFEREHDAYLAMAYIDGISLSEQVTMIYGGNSWTSLDKSRQMLLIDYAIQVIDIVHRLHQNGYIHRDLNPENFLVTPSGKLFLIDFELCYAQPMQKPDPVFTLGTPGYLSPEQNEQAIPTIAEDIYGLGGLLIKLFTGLSPLKFESHDLKSLSGQLNFFIPDPIVTALICSCRDIHPLFRPPLTAIGDHLLSIKNGQKSSAVSDYPAWTSESKVHGLKTTVQQAIRSLYMGTFKSSGPVDQDNSLATGVTGILLVLAQAAIGGFTVKDAESFIAHCFSRLQQTYLWGSKETSPGLLWRSSGVCLMMVELYQAGQISSEQVNTGQLHDGLLTLPFDSLHLAGGIAGHGMAILHSLPYIDPNMGCRLLNHITQNLLTAQEKDGSWLIQPENRQTKSIKLPGLFYGTAGIAWFLMNYGTRFNHIPAKEAARRALDWLIDQRHPENGQLIWARNPHVKTIDPWLADGFTGIALAFIKAYECFHETRFKEVATSALLCHPEAISSNALSFGSGLAGLGEVYLEAARVFGDGPWQKRTDRIADFLMHTGNTNADGCRYWIADGQAEPEAGFMEGHTGILHFLIRYSAVDKISFPFIGLNLTT